MSLWKFLTWKCVGNSYEKNFYLKNRHKGLHCIPSRWEKVIKKILESIKNLLLCANVAVLNFHWTCTEEKERKVHIFFTMMLIHGIALITNSRWAIFMSLWLKIDFICQHFSLVRAARMTCMMMTKYVAINCNFSSNIFLSYMNRSWKTSIEQNCCKSWSKCDAGMRHTEWKIIFKNWKIDLEIESDNNSKVPYWWCKANG